MTGRRGARLPAAGIWLILALLLMQVGGPVAPAAAQEETATLDSAEGEESSQAVEGEAEAAPPVYLGVPLTEIAVEGRDAEIMLRDVRRELQEAGAADRIRPLFEQELETNEALMAAVDPEQIAALDRRRLGDLRSLLAESVAKMEGWQRELAASAGRFETRFNESKAMEKRWEATVPQAEMEGVPVEVGRRVGSILEGLHEVESDLEKRLAHLLTLQDDIAEAELYISDGLAQVSSSEGEFRGNMFIRDSPPLVGAIRDWPGGGIAQMRDEAVRRLRSVQQYVLRNPDKWITQGILFAVLFALMIVLRQRSGTWEAEGYEAPLATTRFMVQRPVSAALVLALVGSIWIHPNMPLGVGQILMLVALVPLGRLLAGLASKRVRSVLLALAVVFVIHQGSDLLPEAGPGQRLMLLFEMAIAVTGLGLLWHKRKEKYRSSSGWLGAMRYIVPAALAMTGVSVLANLLGRTQLASILADSVVTGAALAVLVWVCALITAAMARMGVRRRRRAILNVVQNHSKTLERFTVLAINATATYVWLRAFLGLLELYNPLVEWLVRTVDHEWIFGKVTISLRTVLTFATILLIAVVLARLIRIILDEEVFARLKLPRGFPGLISLLVRYPILLLGFILAVSAAGIDLTSFGLMAGALGVGIGFGMQNIIANFVSGIILTFERPIQVGDTIAVGQLLGNVTEIGVRSSKVKTFDGSEVIVPNGDLISKEVINWTLSDRRRKMKLPVKVAFDSDPHRVLEILGKVAADHPDSLVDPPPKVLFNGHGDNGLDFTLMYWVMFEKGISSRSDVALAIYDELAKAGIQAPIPRSQVLVAEGEGSAAKPAAAGSAATQAAAAAKASGTAGSGGSPSGSG